MSHRRRFLLFAAVLGLAAAPSAEANTWKVGRDISDCPGGCNFYDGILGSNSGDGIKVAMESPSVVSGDTVLVWRGSRTKGGVLDYPAVITMKSGVKLVAFGYPDSVPAISGTRGGVPGIFMSNASEVTEVTGFDIKWDAGTAGTLGGGIAAYASLGTIKNNRFLNCNAGIGAGIYLQSCFLTVTNNVFIDNTCSSGGGVIAISGGVPVISRNTIYRASAPLGAEGSAIYATGTDFILQNNIIYGSLGAAAVFCGGGNNPTIQCNIFYANQFGTYGGQCPDSTGTSGNIIADPLFCNAAVKDFGLCSDSPALGSGCGGVGYVSPLGGCASCASTPVWANFRESSWGMVKAGYR